MKRMRLLGSKTMTVLLLILIVGNCYGLLSWRWHHLTPVDFGHCGVFQFYGADGYGRAEFTNIEETFNITQEGQFCANVEFFAQTDAGLMELSALSGLHNGDLLTVIPVYDSVYSQLLKVDPDTSPVKLEVADLLPPIQELDSRLVSERIDILHAVTLGFAGQASWITHAVRTDENGEGILIVIFEDLKQDGIYAVEVKGACFDENDAFHFASKTLRRIDPQVLQQQADADPTWQWGNGKGLVQK